ncbi:hypothetical protein Y88_3374 [Novosphingobium nitrogenifigens DSM 19370]|uniref:Uncharacterized protein n=1 Tax=Novosphingobium nitrogenifigens DSM 19370 TaxID=983920 RepID=F1Z3E2_9SPHN|nr:hypothetical protein Y88_3374 [Novosphingobium nitrogenifigens DSM 19370]
MPIGFEPGSSGFRWVSFTGSTARSNILIIRAFMQNRRPIMVLRSATK